MNGYYTDDYHVQGLGKNNVSVGEILIIEFNS